MQIAVAAAGGRVRKMPERMEAGISRRIVAIEAGRSHPLLAGRGGAWDVPAIHRDEVEELPQGATLLATNPVTRVQAVEIRHDRRVFWSVQYHPELALGKGVIALRHQADDLVTAGLAESRRDVNARADQIEALHRKPDERALRWLLGVDGEFADEEGRRREIINFLTALPAIDRRPQPSVNGAFCRHGQMSEVGERESAVENGQRGQDPGRTMRGAEGDRRHSQSGARRYVPVARLAACQRRGNARLSDLLPAHPSAGVGTGTAAELHLPLK